MLTLNGTEKDLPETKSLSRPLSEEFPGDISTSKKPKTRMNYPPEFREKVATDMVVNHLTPTEAARKYKVSAGNATNWRDKKLEYRAGRDKTVAPVETTPPEFDAQKAYTRLVNAIIAEVGPEIFSRIMKRA